MHASRISLVPAALALVLAAGVARAAGPEEIYVGYTVIPAMDRRNPPEEKMEFLVVYPQGLALRQIPPGGVDLDSAEKLAEKRDSMVGSYTRTGGTLDIEWGAGSRKHQTWSLEASGAGWTRGPNTTFRLASRLSQPQIKGIWQHVSGMKQPGIMSMSTANEFIFRSNGEFEQGKKHGRFELDGYTLVLHDSDGATRRHTIYRWPWAAGTIAIDTSLFQLLQSRQ
jgi:hypothetical protein